MRIDLNTGLQPSSANSQSIISTLTEVSDSTLDNAAGEDEAGFCDAQPQVQRLADQALRFPEIRHEKINALRKVIREGSYDRGPEQVADAVLEHMLAPPAD